MTCVKYSFDRILKKQMIFKLQGKYRDLYKKEIMNLEN